MFFKIDSNKSLRGSLTKSGTVGAFLGVAAPVCASCGIGMLSLIGLGGALIFLPFQGLEIGLLSIALLSYSVITLGSNVNSYNKCKVEIKKGGGKNGASSSRSGTTDCTDRTGRTIR